MTRYKRRKRQVTDLIESLAGLIFLAALVYGPKLLGWFDHRPWATPLAIVTLTTGGLGFAAFFITVKKIRKQEEERRRLAEDDWLKITPAEFEKYVATLFRARGYQAKVTGGPADGGVDILVKKADQKGLVQCKQYTKRKVGVKEMREFADVLTQSNATEGFFVTTTSFTGPAQERAGKAPMTLVDGDRLAAWMKEARRGPYARPVRYPLYFSAGQWLTLVLLATTTIGVFGFLAGVLILG